MVCIHVGASVPASGLATPARGDMDFGTFWGTWVAHPLGDIKSLQLSDQSEAIRGRLGQARAPQ